ncbi:MAG TPA: hypothetical protein VFE96_08825 [Candidatus Bathyarchaeia archaeon]|nr:hypothetical protein [Candidatus Bathyarchaeia archaeon]
MTDAPPPVKRPMPLAGAILAGLFAGILAGLVAYVIVGIPGFVVAFIIGAVARSRAAMLVRRSGEQRS